MHSGPCLQTRGMVYCRHIRPQIMIALVIYSEITEAGTYGIDMYVFILLEYMNWSTSKKSEFTLRGISTYWWKCAIGVPTVTPSLFYQCSKSNSQKRSFPLISLNPKANHTGWRLISSATSALTRAFATVSSSLPTKSGLTSQTAFLSNTPFSISPSSYTPQQMM